MLATLGQMDELRKEVFFAKAMALKMDRASRGLSSNVNIADLWPRAPQDVREFERFLVTMFEADV